MLSFVGLGLFDEKDISLKGLERVRNADKIYVEFYTSRLFGTTIEKMEHLYSKEVSELSREDVEQTPSWLEEAKELDVVFLTGGDTMVSTTHIDLRLRAMELGIETSLIHGASISSAICGLSGLQNYRFGKSTTIPHPYVSSRGREVISQTPYETIQLNTANGLHTAVFLDIDRDKGYMTANKAIELLLKVGDIRGDDFMEERIVVGIARAGCAAPVVRAGPAKELIDVDLGPALHILVVPASLHFVEAEALVKLGGAPDSILEGMEE